MLRVGVPCLHWPTYTLSLEHPSPIFPPPLIILTDLGLSWQNLHLLSITINLYILGNNLPLSLSRCLEFVSTRPIVDLDTKPGTNTALALNALDNLKAKLKAAFKKKLGGKQKTEEPKPTETSTATATTPAPADTKPTETTPAAPAPATAPVTAPVTDTKTEDTPEPGETAAAAALVPEDPTKKELPPNPAPETIAEGSAQKELPPKPAETGAAGLVPETTPATTTTTAPAPAGMLRFALRV